MFISKILIYIKKSGMVKIIIVDDHSLFREGIKVLIDCEKLGEVIAEAENGQEFLDLLEIHNPDIVFMDINMPIMNGLEATKNALKIKPNLKVLVITMLSEQVNYTEMINAGAKGFISKSTGKHEFEKAINAVLNGDSYFSNELLRQIILDLDRQQIAKKVNNSIMSDLTQREKEVLEGFCEGLNVTEIAERLFLSPKTIDAHRSNLLKKTNSKNTINLVLFAIKNELVII